MFGTAYYPDHWPEEEWYDDLSHIRDAGITLVRFGEFSWSWYEPQPEEYDFAAFDRFLSLLDRVGLDLCLCTPTATPPPWFDRYFPDGRLMNMYGLKCLSPRHFWCWNHPASLARAEQTITTLANRYRQYPRLKAWQIDNEPNYSEQTSTDPAHWYDWNPHSQKKFAHWLEEKYQAIERLNHAWFTAFWSQRMHDWEEAARPRGRANPHQWLDFLRWREDNLAQQVRRQRDLLRAITPHVPIGVNIPETGVHFSLVIGQDYWAQAEGMDWVGTDLYEASGDRTRDLQVLAYRTDLLRSAAGPARFLISETQAGPHVRGWPNRFAGESFGPDYLEACAKLYFQHGAKDIWWFLFRPTRGGQEIGMNGLQNLDGSDSERTRSVRLMAKDPDLRVRYRSAWLNRPLIRVHYSRDSLRFRTSFQLDTNDLEEELAGWHGLLEALGYRVDFFDDTHLSETLADNRTPIVLPFTLLVREEDVQGLSQAAGTILCGPHTGLCDHNGQLHPHLLPGKLVEVWGLRWGNWVDTPAPTLETVGPVPGYRIIQVKNPNQVRQRAGELIFRAVSTNGKIHFFAVGVGGCWQRGAATTRTTMASWTRTCLDASLSSQK